jgi:hypothetical protein
MTGLSGGNGSGKMRGKIIGIGVIALDELPSAMSAVVPARRADTPGRGPRWNEIS